MTFRWILGLGVLAAGCNAHTTVHGVRSVTLHTDSASLTAARKHFNSLPDADYTAGIYTAGNGHTIPYRLLKPEQAQPGKKYPLVITLHNSSRIGSDNQRQLEPLARIWLDTAIRKAYPAFVLAPQFAQRSANYTTDNTGEIVSAVPDADLLQLVPLIDSMKQWYAVDADRIYVAGYSMGGSSALSLVAHTQHLFAAAVAIAPVTEMDSVARLRQTPIWLIHGTDDTENPFTVSQRFYQAAGEQAPILFWQVKQATHNTIVAPELLSDKIPAWLLRHSLKH